MKTLTGDVVDAAVVPVHNNKMLVFESRPASYSGHELSTCGEALDLAMGVCFSEPEYLLPQEARRHLTFLYDLLHFETKVYTYGDSLEGKVGDLPLRHFYHAIENWVSSFVFQRHDLPGLYPHFALHTADFLSRSLEGTHQNYFSGLPWRVEPLLTKETMELLERHSLFDSAFKSRFTQNTYCRLIAKVPEGITIKSPYLVFNAGEIFEFAVRRCHLSQTVGDYTCFEIMSACEPPQFQIEELTLNGDIIVRHPNGAWQELRLDLPASWITHELQRNRAEGYVEVPVKSW